MASLGVLASLMQTMTPPMPQYNPQEVALAQQRIQGGRMGNETALIELQRLKQSQASEAEVMAAIKNNPELAQQLLGGGSVLGSLGPGGGPPGGPLTQQAVQPGMPPGSQQVVPGGQDLSQFATQVTPPQSVLGSLGPQPQGPMQGQQNPLLAMAQRDPRAALMLQQQMQAQQDRQFKLQEQRLKMGSAMMGSLGQMAQGVTDQAGWDQLRQDAAQIDPKLAARLPQVYSKEVRDRVVTQALDVKEAMTLQVADLQAQAALVKARKEGRSTDVDNHLRAMGVQPGQETPAQMKEALQAVQEGKIAVSASHGTGQLVQTPQGIVRVNPRTGNVDPVEAPGGGPMYPKPTAEEQRAASYGDRAKAAHDITLTLENKGLKPSLWGKGAAMLPAGVGNYLVSEDRQKYTQAINQFAQAILRKESGAAISPTEYEMTDKTYFPQPGDSKEVVTQKRAAREGIIKSLQEEGKQTGRTGSQPQGQAPAGTGKPVAQMSREELLSERDRLRKGGG